MSSAADVPRCANVVCTRTPKSLGARSNSATSCQSSLVVDDVFAVQGEEDEHQLVHGAGQARGRSVGVCARRELVREGREAEFSRPKIVLYHCSSQGFGVVRDSPFQHIKPRFWVEQGNARRDLTEVSCAEESEGRMLGVIEFVPTRFRISDDSLQVFKATIDEVDALSADGQPRPAVDPRAPLEEGRNHRRGRIVNLFG